METHQKGELPNKGGGGGSAQIARTGLRVVAGPHGEVVPTQNDILVKFGSIGLLQSNLGSKRLMLIIENKHSLFMHCSTNEERFLLARDIVDFVRHRVDPPGRFLTQNKKNGQWFDVGDPSAIDNVMQLIRGYEKFKREGHPQTDSHYRGDRSRSENSSMIGKRNLLELEAALHIKNGNNMLQGRSVSTRLPTLNTRKNVNQIYKKDLENRMLLAEFSSPAMFSSLTHSQQIDVRKMFTEADNYFEAGLTGISIDDYFQNQNQMSTLLEEKRKVQSRVSDALKNMGENALSAAHGGGV
mmetsp:Transcript_10554/g.13722  ORF Transcript_10554/g.13722 Transcript_10554/m.13722 type:complete len:298 (-) Transcript_10554:159-1052(-)